MYSLFLQPSTEQEIIEICTSLREGTAAGYDQITIVQPLTNFLATFQNVFVPLQIK